MDSILAIPLIVIFSGVKEYLEANISSFTGFLFDLVRLVEWFSKLGVGGG